jgi:L,D-transpeptidase catalytic domain
MLGWTLGSVLSYACLPLTAAAQDASVPAQEAATAAVSPDSGLVAPDSGLVAPDRGPIWAVTTGEASLRGQPDIADNRFGFARPGTPLQVLSYTGDWANVYNPHTQGTAYVYANLLAPGNAPSRYVSLAAPPLLEQIQDTVVLTQDSVLATYPSTAPDASFMPLQASALETVIGSVRGEDGAIWYQTTDFYYVPSTGVFLGSQSGAYPGRWLLATLTPTTRVVAYEGQSAVRTMLALRGIARYPTPTGVFSIQRRVPNEIMDSVTVGIPHSSPFGYYVTGVLYTQYFTPDGASLHDNYWSSNFGGIGSHGCLGLSLADSKWLWDWATIGTPVVVNP